MLVIVGRIVDDEGGVRGGSGDGDGTEETGPDFWLVVVPVEAEDVGTGRN